MTNTYPTQQEPPYQLHHLHTGTLFTITADTPHVPTGNIYMATGDRPTFGKGRPRKVFRCSVAIADTTGNPSPHQGEIFLIPEDATVHPLHNHHAGLIPHG